MQVLLLENGYVKLYQINSLSGFMAYLKEYEKEVGVPEICVADTHP